MGNIPTKRYVSHVEIIAIARDDYILYGTLSDGARDAREAACRQEIRMMNERCRRHDIAVCVAAIEALSIRVLGARRLNAAAES